MNELENDSLEDFSHFSPSLLLSFSLSTRLELTPRGAFPPFNRAPAEGGMSHLWDLSC